MADLYSTDKHGERWLDNPSLIIANPKNGGKKKMASRRKRRQPEALRRYWASRRRPKSNFPSAGMLVNPRRKRRARRAGAHRRRSLKANPPQRRYRSRFRSGPVARRRRYARNPQGMSLMGFKFPALDAILFTSAGMIVPPIVQRLVAGYLPVAWQTSKPAMYMVKAGSVFVPSMLVRQFVSRRAGNLMLLGGVVSLTVDLVREFMPGLGSQPFLGQYVSMRPGMGKYVSEGGGPGMIVRRQPMIADTPDRLSPVGRF